MAWVRALRSSGTRSWGSLFSAIILSQRAAQRGVYLLALAAIYLLLVICCCSRRATIGLDRALFFSTIPGTRTPKSRLARPRNGASQILQKIDEYDPSLQHKPAFNKVVILYRRCAEDMADYYALIGEAIADKKTGESRRAFYDRARIALVDNLRKADPPVPETLIEQERLALEDAISKVEADAMGSEGTLSMPNGLQTQNDHSGEHTRSAAPEASSAQVDAKVQMRRERRIAFWGFLIVAAFWIGDLFYERPTFSGWYDCLRLGGFIFFPTMTILSYFILQTKGSVEKEERAYVVFTPIILVGAILVSVALYYGFEWLATAPL
jgi:hypothetical protein